MYLHVYIISGLTYLSSGDYNKFVRHTGRHTCVQKEQQCLINEKTTLLDLMSSETLGDATGKDCIFQVIEDIVRTLTPHIIKQQHYIFFSTDNISHKIA